LSRFHPPRAFFNTKASTAFITNTITSSTSPQLVTTQRFSSVSGPQNKKIQGLWYRCYPTIGEERWRDMYRCYYPYLFDHGDKMSLYPKIPENPREWQPEQLFATYDAVREDKYDSFLKLREKFPELYSDTLAWENPPAFGEFNQFYSVRLGMVGVKAFTQPEFDEYGNRMLLTALWFPDNQVIEHKLGSERANGTASGDMIVVGAMNVPIEFHKPYITAAYKAKRVPVKHVSTSFYCTPDAFVPVGTKLDVRHFRVGQEVDLQYQITNYGWQGVMIRHGFDGGPVWLGDSKWSRRPGSIGTEGESRILPGTRMAGQVGANAVHRTSIPIYRIDYKNQLIYVAHTMDADIGSYVRISDSLNMYGKTTWNAHQGLPPFPTFVPDPEEDLSAMSTHDCQLVSLPLYPRMMDEADDTSLISQADVEDAKAVKPAAPVAKKKSYEYNKYWEARKKVRKARREKRKKYMVGRRAEMSMKQDEARAEKLRRRRRVI
jgi:ribosomal protein L3